MRGQQPSLGVFMNSSSNSDSLLFARFMFTFHWAVHALAAAFCYAIALTTQDGISYLFMLGMSAIIGWSMSRENQGWQIEDAAWHGFCLAWQDAVFIGTVFIFAWAGPAANTRFIIAAATIAAMPRVFSYLYKRW